MKIVLHQCDWCGVKEPASGDEDELPKGWRSNFDELGHDDTLCAGCMASARRFIEDALEKAKEYRLAIVSGQTSSLPAEWAAEPSGTPQEPK